jgi:NitT/TauT family transport system permease protein
MTRLQWMLALVSLALTAIALMSGLAGSAVVPFEPLWFIVLAAGLFLATALRGEQYRIIWASAALSSLGAFAVIAALGDEAARGVGFWSLLIGSWLAAWLLVERLSALPDAAGPLGLLRRFAIPVLFGVWLLVLWEVIVRATNVPAVLLPPPSMIWERLIGSLPILWVDFRQTFLKAVIAGYAIGCLSGFAVAVLVDRVGFLKRGLMPIGNLMSALPIIGIAPIMVMWFGFDWQSKAAVVVVMTFFPMLVNSVAGLSAAGAMERDLMHTYAAGYWSSLVKLRIPAALPFIFNALKINSTLALIGAIVAEFFGTPIYGMGFRISTEVGRMNIDMVWAEIAVAALAGSSFYGLVSLIERAFTFWHPSYRSG